MSIDNTKNFAITQLDGGIDASATTIDVVDASVFPTVEFNAVIWNSDDYANPAIDANVEIVRITNISGNTLTVTRGQESTTPSEHNGTGTTYSIANTITSKMIDDIRTDLDKGLNDLNDVDVPTPAVGDSIVYEGDGYWRSINLTNIQGGGQAVTVYFDNDITYDGYGTLSKIPDTVTPETEMSGTASNSTVFIKGFFYDSEIQRDYWSSGEWLLNLWARVSSTAGITTAITGVYNVPASTGTVTITGTGTSRTATVSGATPFVSGDANADQTLSGYLQTAGGTFQITGYTSTSVVTITTPSGYVNETDATYTVHKYLFQAETERIDNSGSTPILYSTRSIQPQHDLELTDEAAVRVYVKTTSVAPITLYIAYNGTQHYSNIRLPIFPKHNDLDGLDVGDWQHFTAENKTDLTDGGDSILHYHASDRNLANASGTLGVANGGTGKTSITLNSYLKGNGTSAPIERTYAEVLADLSGQATSDFSMASQKITSLADPTSDQDAVTKKHFDDNSINNVVEDTTPQLGGELDCQAHTIGFTQQTATGDGTTTIDWKLGNKFKFTFGAFNETFTFTAPTKPCNLVLMMVQDGTGSRTATFPATVKWAGGTAPTLSTTSGDIDIISFYFDGTSYYGVASLDFS